MNVAYFKILLTIPVKSLQSVITYTKKSNLQKAKIQPKRNKCINTTAYNHNPYHLFLSLRGYPNTQYLFILTSLATTTTKIQQQQQQQPNNWNHRNRNQYQSSIIITTNHSRAQRFAVRQDEVEDDRLWTLCRRKSSIGWPKPAWSSRQPTSAVGRKRYRNDCFPRCQ